MQIDGGAGVAGRRTRGFWWVLAIAVVCVMLLGGVVIVGATRTRAVGAGNSVIRVPTPDAKRVVVTASYLIAGVPPTVFRQLDGVAVWRLPQLIDSPESIVEAGTALLITGHRFRQPVDAPPTVVALDAATGSALWERPGRVVAVRDGDGIVVDEADVEGVTIARIDAAGMPRWSVTQAAGTHIGSTPSSTDTRPHGADQPDLIFVRPDHRLGAVALDDGTVTEIGPSAVSAVDLWNETTIIGEVQKSTASKYPATEQYVAYDRATGHELWRSRPFGWLYACGPVICVDGGAVVAGYDWRTGREVWRSDRGYIYQGYWDRPGGGLVLVGPVFKSARLLTARLGAVAYEAPADWAFIGLNGGSLLLLHPWNRDDHQPWFGAVPASGPLTMTKPHPAAGPGGQMAACVSAPVRLVCRRDDALLLIASPIP